MIKILDPLADTIFISCSRAADACLFCDAIFFNYAGGATAIGYGIWLLVAGILCLVFVSKAKKELADENNQNKTPFIITIVFGAIAGNVFYVLAGIFGLIADGQQGNKEEPKQVEEPKEEPKE